MTKRFDIYGIGAALVDTEIEVTDSELQQLGIDKGVMTLVDETRQHYLLDALSDHLIASKRASGGSAANTIIAASYFGAKTFYSCKVADDDNGTFYLQDLRDAGVVHHHQCSDPEGITGKCLVMITPDAERTMNTFLGISETVSVAELDAEAIAASHYVYIEGYLVTSSTGRTAAIELHRLARQHKTKIALSLSDPAMAEFFRDGLSEMIGSGVDLLFCNEQEALTFTGTSNLDDAITQLRRHSRQLAITRGARGALLFDGEQLIEVAAAPAQAIDTNGAGDMFAGAFLFALTQAQDFATAGKLATTAAAQVVSQFGPRLSAEQHRQILALQG